MQDSAARSVSNRIGCGRLQRRGILAELSTRGDVMWVIAKGSGVWISLGALIGVMGLLLVQWLMDIFKNRCALSSRRRIFLGRQTMRAEEWYDCYFAPLGLSHGAAQRIAESLSKVLHCDPTQIWPSDRFDKEFSVKCVSILGLDDADDEMDMFFDVELPQLLGRVNYDNLEKTNPFPQTVGDLVKWCEPHIAGACDVVRPS